jgi:hypothetical protein
MNFSENTTQISKYGQMCQVVEDGKMTTLIFSLYTDLAPQTAIDPKMWCKPYQYQILLKSVRAYGTEKCSMTNQFFAACSRNAQ